MTGPDTYPDDYDVRWDSPSTSATASMPCGAGGVGLNVWCEGADLLIYVDRSGSFDENNQMLKLGRLRVTLPRSPATAEVFQQRLVLRSNHIEISTVHGAHQVLVRVWVEVHRPVVHLDLQSSEPVGWQVGYESWRTAVRRLSTAERAACYSLADSDRDLVEVVTHPDTFEVGDATLTWWHRNRAEDLLRDKVLLVEHLIAHSDEVPDPQRDFTFGGRLQGAGLGYAGPTSGVQAGTPFTGWRYTSVEPTTDQQVELTLAAGVHADLESWRAGLSPLSTAAERAESWESTRAWWAGFWARSRVVIDPTGGPTSPAWRVGRNYQLFRAMLGANAYGSFPTKFNGGLFTVDPEPVGPGAEDGPGGRTPDFRAWGGGSGTAQNQRLVHFPMLRAGDLDLIEPQLEFYRAALPGAELRTRAAWGHRGASFTEQMENFGLPCLGIYDWGWGQAYGVAPRPGAEIGELHNKWCADQYDTVLEFCLLALDRESYGGPSVASFLPVITSVLRFFDEHYRMLEQQRTGSPLGSDGRLVIYPGSACETYKQARDAAPTVAGLQVVAGRLLARTDLEVPEDDRTLWARVATTVPELPRREMDGVQTLAPARSWGFMYNEEFPQLYPVYPWGLFGVGLPELQLARDTFRVGADEPDQHGVLGWKQDPIFAARLGLIDQAATMVVQKLDDAPRRFPAFWGPGFDWTPDHNHGGSGAVALQEMLLQTPGDAIHLFPAWPPEWDVDLRLHAPHATVVEATLVGGVLVRLVVSPPERRRDLTVHGVADPGHPATRVSAGATGY